MSSNDENLGLPDNSNRYFNIAYQPYSQALINIRKSTSRAARVNGMRSIPWRLINDLSHCFTRKMHGLLEVDTIFALSTAPGKSGVAIFRISGPKTQNLLRTVLPVTSFGRLISDPRRLIQCHIIDADKSQILDAGMAVYFKGPASFTGEDAAELHVHGSPAVLRAITRSLSSLKMLVRMARAGEFAERAWRNGKVQLDQVEALADLVAAETEAQRKQAIWAMSIDRRDIINGWRRTILNCMARVEAWIDFGEDEQIDASQSLDRVRSDLDDLTKGLRQRISHDRDAELVRSGFHVVIAGKPNAGKSSLLNRLAGRRAAITSDTPGTTRDPIKVEMDLGGVSVCITDTAGLRSTEDEVEREGVGMAREACQTADYILYLTSDPNEAIDILITDDTIDRTKIIPVLTKADLTPDDPVCDMWKVSSVDENLFEIFKERLTGLIRTRLAHFTHEPPVLVQERHRQCIHSSLTCLDSAMHCLDDSSPSKDVVLAAEGLRRAAYHIGQLSGQSIDHEEVLDNLFSSFCIGK